MAAIGARQATAATGRKSAKKLPRAIRRILLLKKAGLVGSPTFTGTIRRARTSEELRDAYELVHDVYVEQGYIPPSLTGLRLRAFEALPEMCTFIAEEDSQVVGVMSIVRDMPEMGMPSDKAFHPELGALRRQGRLLSEVTNLAIRSGYRKTSVFFDLIKPCWAQALSWRCDHTFIAVSPEHIPFFRDVMQFAPYGDPRDYSKEVEDIVVGMLLDYHTAPQQFTQTDSLLGNDAFLYDSFYAKNKFIGLCDEWMRSVRDSFNDPEFLKEVFVHCGDLFGRCSWRELECIRKAWGDELFDAVFNSRPCLSDPEGVGMYGKVAVSGI